MARSRCIHQGRPAAPRAPPPTETKYVLHQTVQYNVAARGTGALPCLGLLPSLTYVKMHRNALTGTHMKLCFHCSNLRFVGSADRQATPQFAFSVDPVEMFFFV